MREGPEGPAGPGAGEGRTAPLDGVPGLSDPRLRLAVLGCAELVALAALGWWPGVPLPYPGIPLFLAGFAAYLLAAGEVGRPGPRSALHPGWIWGFALAFRAALIPLAPELSDDVWRYLWDGHLQLQGINPYVHAPSDPALAGLRTGWHALINHPDVPTIYPPVAQLAFLLVALAGPSVLGAKLLWLLLDLAAAFLLVRVAEETGRPGRLVGLLYLWSPLLVVETAWSAHLEVLGLAALALLLRLHVARRPAGVGAAAAVGTLVKLAPAAALPALVRREGREGGFRLAAAFVGTVAILYLPYLAAGSDLFGGLSAYVARWRFNDGLFGILAALLPSLAAAKGGAAAVVVGVVAWATLRRFDPERALFWTLGAGLLLAPTVHPWYVLWILPFAALRGSRPWILLTGLVFLAYWGLGTYLREGSWPEPLWLRLLEWGPVLLLLAVAGARLLLRPEPAGERRSPPTPRAR